MAEPSQDTEQQRNQAIFLAKLWLDERLKQRFLQDPAAVLTEEGMPPPLGIEVTALENTSDHYYIVLPQRPDEGDVSDEDLAQVAGGVMITFCTPDMCVPQTVACLATTGNE